MIHRNKNCTVCMDFILFCFTILNEGRSMPNCNLSVLKETQFTNMIKPITIASIKKCWKHKIDIAKCNSFLYSRNESETLLYPNSNNHAKGKCLRHIVTPLHQKNEIVCRAYSAA